MPPLRLLRELREAFSNAMRPEFYARGAALQERVDIMRLYVLMSNYDSWPKFAVRTVEDLEKHAPTMTMQREAVAESAFKQSVAKLEGWRRERPALPPPATPLPENAPPEVRAAAEELLASVTAEQEAKSSAAQYRAFGFRVRTGTSTAGQGAGQGLYVDGCARLGSIVAFWPGVAYSPADILRLPNGMRRFQHDGPKILRFDGVLLDASTLHVVPPDAVACPLMLAHKANHPPEGTRPNVMPCPVDFSDAVPRELEQLLPNVRAPEAEARLKLPRPPPSSWQESFDELVRDNVADLADEGDGTPMRGLAFIAMRDIVDEEVFHNYRLNPAIKYPPWYSPVDVEEDKLRWQNA